MTAGKIKIALIGALLVGTALMGGCIGNRESPSEISGTGTVKFIDLEGGFYGIESDDGERYDPLNLAQEFQVDGLRVRFEAKVREDVVTTHMWGTPIEITRIEKLDR